MREQRAIGMHFKRASRVQREPHDHHAPRIERVIAIGRRGDREKIPIRRDDLAEPPRRGQFGRNDMHRVDRWRRRERVRRMRRQLGRREHEDAARRREQPRATPRDIAWTNGSPSPAATLRCGRTFASRLSGHRSLPPFRRLIRRADAITRGAGVAKVRSFYGWKFESSSAAGGCRVGPAAVRVVPSQMWKLIDTAPENRDDRVRRIQPSGIGFGGKPVAAPEPTA